MVDGVRVPAYGSASLADLLPAVLSSLGVPGERDVLGLAPTARAVVLLVDGLGAELLRRHAAAARSKAVARGCTTSGTSTSRRSVRALTGDQPSQPTVCSTSSTQEV